MATHVDGEHLNLDVSAEEARALHRIVRAMHDGHCPNCGGIHDSKEMRTVDGKMVELPCEGGYRRQWRMLWSGWRCPSCSFQISDDEAQAALMAFQPYLKRSLEVFEKWRKSPEPRGS